MYNATGEFINVEFIFQLAAYALCGRPAMKPIY
jgi:hypothetical protein